MLEEHVDDELPSMALDFGDVLTGVAFRAFEIDDYAVIYSPAFPVREREVRGLAGRGKFPATFSAAYAAFFPEILITPMPPFPSGVALAAMVSLMLFMMVSGLAVCRIHTGH